MHYNLAIVIHTALVVKLIAACGQEQDNLLYSDRLYNDPYWTKPHDHHKSFSDRLAEQDGHWFKEWPGTLNFHPTLSSLYTIAGWLHRAIHAVNSGVSYQCLNHCATEMKNLARVKGFNVDLIAHLCETSITEQIQDPSTQLTEFSILWD